MSMSQNGSLTRNHPSEYSHPEEARRSEGAMPLYRLRADMTMRLIIRVMMEVICDVVLNFPDLSAGMMTFFAAASERSPVMTNSLEMMRMTIHAGI